MPDAMLGELYRRSFETKRQAEEFGQEGEPDRMRQVAIAKNKLLSELINIRTNQIKDGEG